MRTVWIEAADVEGYIDAGATVVAARPLTEWCLRDDDGGEPIPVGTALEVLELRPWGKAMAQELPMAHDAGDRIGDPEVFAEIVEAANELAEVGLWEWERTG